MPIESRTDPIVLQVIDEDNVHVVISSGIGPQGPAGAGGTGSIEIGETPSGTIDGSNATFTTTAAFVPGQVRVFINGIAQRAGTDFTTSGTQTILLTSSPQVGDFIQVDYERG